MTVKCSALETEGFACEGPIGMEYDGKYSGVEEKRECRETSQKTQHQREPAAEFKRDGAHTSISECGIP